MLSSVTLSVLNAYFFGLNEVVTPCALLTIRKLLCVPPDPSVRKENVITVRPLQVITSPGTHGLFAGGKSGGPSYITAGCAKARIGVATIMRSIPRPAARPSLREPAL